MLGVAADATVSAAVEQATLHGKRVMVDLIGVEHKAERVAQVKALGVDAVAVRTSLRS